MTIGKPMSKQICTSQSTHSPSIYFFFFDVLLLVRPSAFVLHLLLRSSTTSPLSSTRALLMLLLHSSLATSLFCSFFVLLLLHSSLASRISIGGSNWELLRLYFWKLRIHSRLNFKMSCIHLDHSPNLSIIHVNFHFFTFKALWHVQSCL
ncbi:hypothetical protein L6452_03226 [Arctium lappa]|uniref:Uncharacterized protein n=1 Tax=Arctium lappa TaxID=4217 RepID=A0ACB9FLK1_ARCLA|nr:hypothetical protein L6452_03226 [Arctium lappa]